MIYNIQKQVHENKVIHRDIKPANIMRRKDGRLVLIDFGVVKQINTTIARNSGLTSKTIGIGTYDYMPVEQSYGKPKLSSDIYALGMTAIEALISVPLKNLSEDEDTGEIIWNNLAQVSNNLEQFITKMVRFDWRQRYKNAREGLEELNQVFPIIKPQNIQTVTPTKSSENWFDEGYQLVELKRYEEGIASYDKAIAIKPDYHEAWYNRGFALGELKKYEEAIASFEQAIAIKPDKHEAWYNRGVSLWYLQRYEEALKCYENAISIQPDDKLYINNRNDLLRQLGRSN